MTEPSSADRSAALREVEAVNATFYEAFESADLDTMQDLWLDAPDSVCVHPGSTPVRGTGPINRSWALVMANTPYIQFFLTDVQVRVDEDVAYVTCTENVLSSGEGAPEEGFAGGKALATNVFRRTSSGWRLWIHHASPVRSARDDDE